MKKIAILLLLCLLPCLLLTGCKEKQSDTPIFSTQKADDDFSNLFKMTGSGGDALAAVTVEKIEEVTDVIEYYDVIDTTYTKITAALDREFTDQMEGDTLTLYILGTSENFPSRESMVEGRSYILRLESWVHEGGLIWLVSPLESTYLRVFEGEVLVHKNATDLNYKKALTLDGFEEQYDEYIKENPVKDTALADHYQEILDTLESYNYEDEEMEYHLSEEAISARKALAEKLASN